ncbi:MAG: ABC transporter substrate-binding protein, partial [Chitinophagales bacterium]
MKQFNNKFKLVCLLTLAFSFLVACGGGSTDYQVVETGEKTEDATPKSFEVDESGADPSVTAELGGKGFGVMADSLGFVTSGDFNKAGSPEAKKGGVFTMAWLNMPKTLRYIGKDANTTQNWLVSSLVYEGLLGQNTKTQEFLPSLASHWKVGEDKMTYWFRIDPRARWADGKPVVAEDVLESWKIRIDPGIEAPSTNGTYADNYEEPKVLSKYMVELKLKKENWRSILYFSGMPIFPAHYLKRVEGGAGFVQKYKWEMIPGSGPYEMDLDRSPRNEQVVLKRRADYWGYAHPGNEGLYNFDEIKFTKVEDEKLRFEKFKKGEFDLYQVGRAQWWVEELNPDKMDEIKRGLIQKSKIYNFEASGFSGLSFNTREAPFNNVGVRQAFGYLWNIPELNEKLFFNEYAQCTSYFEGTPFANPSNPEPTYNPDKAIELLEAAGWKKKAGQKFLSNNKGELFEIDMDIVQSLERIFTPFQQDLEKVGIKMNLVITDPQTRFNKVLERKFKIGFQSWGGLNIPNPETSMHSKYADPPQTNNITGLKSPEIDKLCQRYDESWDPAERKQILRDIDKLAVAEQQYAFGWGAPYTFRCAYWNKFNMPEWGFPYQGSLNYEYAFSSWWYDAEKAEKLEKARKDESITFPINPVEIDYWGRKSGKPADANP